LFWAARDDLNVTYTPAWLAKRGIMHKLALEHVFGETDYSDLFLSYIRDTDIDEADPSTPFDRNRWGIDWAHDQELPADWRLKIDARLFSDNLYSFDFKEFANYQTDRFLESRVFLERHFGLQDRVSFHAGVWYADDQQNPDDLDRDRFLLQRAPSAGLSVPQLSTHSAVPDLLAAMDVDYAYFWSRQRAEEAYRNVTASRGQFLDTGVDGIPTGSERGATGAITPADNNRDDFPLGPEGDGRFQDGEPLADRGHRLRVNPRLSYPLRVADLVEVTPEVGYHGTLYHTREDNQDARHLITGQLDVRTRLRRVMTLPMWNGPTLHLVEPRFGYTGISSVSQTSNPLFTPAGIVLQDRVRQLELYNITRDPSDRIDSLNALTVGLGNRFYGDTEDDGVARLLADLSFSTQYNLSDDEFGSALIDGTVYPGGGFSSRFNFGYDLGEQRVSEGLFRLGWSHEAGHDVSVHYRFLRDIPPFFESFQFDDERFDEFEDNFNRVNQMSLFTRVALTRNWAVTYNGAYSFEQSLSLANRFGIEYLSKCRCWAIRLELEENRARGFDFNLSYRLIGLGDDTVRPFQNSGSRPRRETARSESATE
jgi:lipopolysaccharide assembly outer membrane protein LptD (OstA)